MNIYRNIRFNHIMRNIWGVPIRTDDWLEARLQANTKHEITILEKEARFVLTCRMTSLLQFGLLMNPADRGQPANMAVAIETICYSVDIIPDRQIILERHPGKAARLTKYASSNIISLLTCFNDFCFDFTC